MMRLYSTRGFFGSVVLLLVVGSTGWAEQSADRLLRLAPSGAGVTLTLEDFRTHAKEFFHSSLSERLWQLPAVQRWFASDDYRQIEQVERYFEKKLGKSAATIRDEILGQAVVLTLVVPPNGRPEDARGLLLLQSADRQLLDRLLQTLNEAQIKKGEVNRIAERKYAGLTYFVREYAPAQSQPPDYYIVFVDDTFAWSNSEEMIQGVIDRREKSTGGLGDKPEFQRMRAQLPKTSVLSLFVNPRLIERCLSATSKPASPRDEKIAAFVTRYLSAVTFVGAAIEWRNGLILHTQEFLEPEKVGPWFERWVKKESKPVPAESIPEAAFAYASVQVDLPALEQTIRELIPDSKRVAYQNALVALKGILLGHEVDQVLAHLGPRVSAWVTATPSSGQQIRFDTVARVDLDGDESIAASLNNGLTTVLALYAMDHKKDKNDLHVDALVTGGVSLTRLLPWSPFGFSVNRERLLIGRDPVALMPASDSGPSANQDFVKVRDEYFANSHSFVWIDPRAILRFAKSHRDLWIEKISKRDRKTKEEVAGDLDRLSTFLSMFRAIYVTSEIASEGHSLHRTLGLIVNEPGAAGASADSKAVSSRAKP